MEDQQKQQLGGCGCFLIVLIIVALAGGAWRTDMTFIPTGVGEVGEQVQFTEELNSQHWVVGLVQGEQPDLKAAINKHVGEGERLTQLTISTKHTFKDVLLAGITVGIYCPVTVYVQGYSAKAAAPAPQPEVKAPAASEAPPRANPPKKK